MLKKKSLGQHFLHSPHYLRLIADTLHIKEGEAVLEIGPGDGALTGTLLARGAKVTAIEKDTRLLPVLEEKFAQEIADQRLHIRAGDALELNVGELKLPKKFKTVGNIPYYITGALLKKYLSEKIQPSMLVFLIQKEVAERIARSKKESILSLSVKAYGEPKYVKTVPRGAFAPAPGVDSAILSVARLSRDNFADGLHEKRFFELVRAGFGQKRKLLAGNLKGLLGPRHLALLEIAGIPKDARAEDVGLAGWLKLAKFK